MSRAVKSGRVCRATSSCCRLAELRVRHAATGREVAVCSPHVDELDGFEAVAEAAA